MTLLEAIRARGLKEPVLRSPKWHQAMFARSREDRPKVFADSESVPYWAFHHGCELSLRQLQQLQQPSSTQAYVTAWCKLNNLKGD